MVWKDVARPVDCNQFVVFCLHNGQTWVVIPVYCTERSYSAHR